NIVSVAVGGSGSEKSVVAGSIAINAIVNGTEARISDGSNIQAGGDVLVEALDQALLVSVAGALGIAPKAGGIGVGVSISWNRVSDAARAWIGDSTIHAGGSVGVNAASGSLLVAVGAAGSG